MMSFAESQFERKGVTDSHTVFPVQHEGNAASDVCIERERDQVEHVSVVFAWVIFLLDIKIQM